LFWMLSFEHCYQLQGHPSSSWCLLWPCVGWGKFNSLGISHLFYLFYKQLAMNISEYWEALCLLECQILLVHNLFSPQHDKCVIEFLFPLLWFLTLKIFMTLLIYHFSKFTILLHIFDRVLCLCLEKLKHLNRIFCLIFTRMPIRCWRRDASIVKNYLFVHQVPWGLLMDWRNCKLA
jgi:hypothetical protein